MKKNNSRIFYVLALVGSLILSASISWAESHQTTNQGNPAPANAPIQMDKRRFGDRGQWVKDADGIKAVVGKGRLRTTPERLGKIEDEPLPCRAEIFFEAPVFEFSDTGGERILMKTMNGQALPYADSVPGAPRLPVYTVKLLLPNEESTHREIVGVKIKPQALTPVEGTHQLACVQQPFPIGEEAKITPPDPEIYGSNEPFPTNAAENQMVQAMRGYDIFLVNVCPVVYEPASGKISYYKKMAVYVLTAEQARMQPFDAGRGAKIKARPKDADKVRGFVNNKDDRNIFETYSSP
ncbi:MAG: hypothetical protein LHV69_03535 [Elusimicrobia bacterium]|nr:hypothetical protein [Candidatus Obscuribacterium magneticum]